MLPKWVMMGMSIFAVFWLFMIEASVFVFLLAYGAIGVLTLVVMGTGLCNAVLTMLFVDYFRSLRAKKEVKDGEDSGL